MRAIVSGVAKVSLTVRIEPVVRGLLEAEATAEGRSVSNMLERVLRERYGIEWEAVLAGAVGTNGDAAVGVTTRDSVPDLGPMRVTAPTVPASAERKFTPDFKKGQK